MSDIYDYMTSASVPCVTLRNGLRMPQVGLGVWQARGQEAVQAVQDALAVGYRLIDTAAVYGNEQEVGEAMQRSDIARADIFLTTKLWNQDQGYKSGLAAMDASLERLGTDYVDLYLIHWPFINFQLGDTPGNNRREETWHAMEEILKAGKAKAIGVSNYTVEHLEEMQTYAHTMPEVNQIEFHPFWFRKELMNYCHERNIAVEDYSPLARAKNLSDPVIGAIAQAHGKTAAQVMLRWAVQHGNSVIPKSIHKDRIRENIDIFDFELSDDEMEQLNNLNENRSAL